MSKGERMREYYVVTNSFAAPFFSDTGELFVCGDTPGDALKKTIDDYTHPRGLFAAAIYEDANAVAKGHAPLMRWQSNAAAKKKGGFLPGEVHR